MVRQAKNWCFTLNNYTEEEYEQLRNSNEKYDYIVIGKEKGSNGTPHLQGHIVFKKKHSARTVKTIVGLRAHIEISKDPSASVKYCKKEGDYIEIGNEPIGRGRRTDLQSVYETIKAGATLGEIREQYFGLWCRYHRAFDRYYMEISGKRDWQTEVFVFHGPTGTGKTKSVHDAVSEAREELYTHTGTDWFDGYNGQPNVLFDDFGGHEFKLTYMLKLLDRYPMSVPIKGGFVNWIPRRIYITSNKHPDEWYQGAYSEHRQALFRRITEIRCIDSIQRN